jgi:integrase
MTSSIIVPRCNNAPMQPLLEAFERRLIGERKSQATRDYYIEIAERLIEYAGGRENIDRETVLSFRDDLSSRISNNSLATYVFSLNSFLEFLNRPDLKLKAPRTIKTRADRLTQEEYRAMLRAAGSFPDPVQAKRDVAMLYLMGDGAARKGEVQNAKLRDVDLEAGVVICRAPKGKDDRVLYLRPEAVRALREYLNIRPPGATQEDDIFLFLTTERQAIKGEDTIRQRMRGIAAKAGLTRRVHPHMLRHMRLTELGTDGTNPFVVMRFAGHKNLQTTMGYVNLDEQEVQRTIQGRAIVKVDIEPEAEVDPAELLRRLAVRLAKGEIDAEAYNAARQAIAAPLEVLR